MKELLPWISIGIVIVGFVVQGLFGSFRLGQAVEQMKATVKEYIDEERDKIVHKVESMEIHFETEQRNQDHNFGEVGAAMRQYIADVEKKLREVEIYGRDNYVKIPDFEKAIDRLAETMAEAVKEIKNDMRQLLKPSN